MARLTIGNIAAPDIGEASAILARSGQSFNQGISSASKLLEQYSQGQQETADNAILGELAGLSSEEDLNSFVNSGALEKLNLSKDMRNTVLGLRKGLLENEQQRLVQKHTQAQTTGVNARTASTNASANRAASEYQNTLNDRNALKGINGKFIASLIEAQKYGNNEINVTDKTSVKSFDQADANRGQAGNDFLAVLQTLDAQPAVAKKLLDQYFSAKKAGQGRIDAADAKAQSEFAAGAILDQVTNENNQTKADVSRGLINNTGFSSDNARIAALKRADPLVDGVLGTTLSTPVETSEQIRNAVELNNSAENLDQQSQLQTRLLKDSGNYKGSNPEDALIKEFELRDDIDGFFTGWEPGELNNVIKKLATKNNIPTELAAVALRENFNEGNPWGFNTPGRIFDIDKADQYIKDNLSQKAIGRFNERRVVSESRRREINTMAKTLKEKRSLANKKSKNGTAVPAKLILEIQSLQNEILNRTANPQAGDVSTSSDVNSLFGDILKPKDPAADKIIAYANKFGIGERLRATAPGSPERQQLMQNLYSTLQNDTNIPDGQKAALMLAIQGQQ